MEKLLFILAQKGKLKIDISQYVTLRLAYNNGNIWFEIDNHANFDKNDPIAKGYQIKNGKQGVLIDKKLEKNNKVLQGIWDIPQVKKFVKEQYANFISFANESGKAREDLRAHIQWSDKLNDDEKELLESVLNLVREDYRIKITENDYLILADFTDRSAQPNRALHIQLVKNDKAGKTYPDIFPEELVAIMYQGIKKNKDNLLPYYKNIELQQARSQFEASKRFIRLKDNFIPLSKEDIEEKYL